jgi:protein CpxP
MLLQRKTFVVSIALAAGLVFGAAGYAQTAAQAPTPAAPVVKAPAQVPPPAGRPGAGVMPGLNLTDAQRAQIRTLRDARRKDSQALRDKMRVARQQLQQARRADIPDEASVRSAAAAVAALQTDQAALQARSRAQVMKVLTPEQQARMKQARARAAQRAQRAQRAVRGRRAQRPMMGPGRMMRPGPNAYRGWGRGMGPMGAPMMGPMWRQRQMRQQALRRWRGWI